MSKFKKDETVNYVKDGQNVKAIIETVHDDDPPNYYYTIKLNDGREKQTDNNNLQKIIEISESKPLSRYEDLKIRVQNGKELGGDDLKYYTKFKDMEDKLKKYETIQEDFSKVTGNTNKILKNMKLIPNFDYRQLPYGLGGKRKSKKVKKVKKRKTKKRGKQSKKSKGHLAKK
jgi:hypothetical protein